jgi:hypothetical protein
MYPLHGSAGLAAPILRCLVGLCRADRRVAGPVQGKVGHIVIFSQFWFFLKKLKNETGQNLFLRSCNF